MSKIAVLGAAGGIGQPLSLLLLSTPGLKHLALFDVVNAPGVAADLAHCNTGVSVTGHVGAPELDAALAAADIVVIPAGVPRKPGMSRDDLFTVNAGIVRDLAEGVARCCPRAIVCVISNPVNSTVPIFAEVLRRRGCFDAARLFGVTTLDGVRAATFLYTRNALQSPNTRVTVLGGHSGHTIVPVFSPYSALKAASEEELAALIHRVQFGGDEVVQAKNGAGSATLSMAFAAKRFVDSLVRARLGESGVVESAYVYIGQDTTIAGAEAVRAWLAEDAPACTYLAVDVEFGRAGAERVRPIQGLSAAEGQLLRKAVEELKGSIAKGVEFIQASKL